MFTGQKVRGSELSKLKISKSLHWHQRSAPADNSFVYDVFVVHLISYKDFALICSPNKHWLKMDYNTDNWEEILQAFLRK